MKLSDCTVGLSVVKRKKCWEGCDTRTGKILKRVRQLGVTLVVVLFEDGKELNIHPKNLYKA